eukprot:1196058-Prorocentrum_minimum.AAC.6
MTQSAASRETRLRRRRRSERGSRRSHLPGVRRPLRVKVLAEATRSAPLCTATAPPTSASPPSKVLRATSTGRRGPAAHTPPPRRLAEFPANLESATARSMAYPSPAATAATAPPHPAVSVASDTRAGIKGFPPEATLHGSGATATVWGGNSQPCGGCCCRREVRREGGALFRREKTPAGRSADDNRRAEVECRREGGVGDGVVGGRAGAQPCRRVTHIRVTSASVIKRLAPPPHSERRTASEALPID